MTNPKPVMLPENDPPHTKPLTLRLPVDLLTRAKIQATRDRQGQGEPVDVTDWIVQLIEATLRQNPPIQEQEPGLGALSLALDQPDDDLDIHSGGASFGTALMITAGSDPDLGNDRDSDRQITSPELGESVAMAQVKTYVSDYVNGYVQQQIQQQLTLQVASHLEQFTTDHQRQLQERLHQHQESFTSLQDNLQNQVNTLQQQLSYCLGE